MKKSKTRRPFKKALAAAAGFLAALFVFIPALAPANSRFPFVYAAGEPEGNGAAVEQPVIENAKTAYVSCLETGEVLFRYNPEIEVYTTSSTKIMTAIVAIEALGDRLSEKVTVTSEMLSEVSGNRLGLSAGEEVTVNDLIHILITGGDNDGAYCLAYLVSGSVSAFVAKMNEKAAAIGAFSTHYTNPTGMHDDGMVTNVTDTALISRYAWSLPIFEEAASTPKYVMEATNMSDYRNVYNRNCLISKYYDASYYNENCSGINAGSTPVGGHCVITVAKKDSLSFLIIVMGADSTDEVIYSYKNVLTLVDWAFDSFEMANVLFEDRMICEIPVTLSSAVDYVTLAPSETVSVFLPTNVDIEKEITYSWQTADESLQAPVKKGQSVGKVSAVYKGNIIASCDLVVTSDVESSEFLYQLNKIEKFTRSKGFIAAVICALILSAGVVLFNAYRRKNRGIF